ncbi:MAG: hypothetical protein V2J25_05620 [Desulfatiglans sp.]|jgi:hypothetical protein|nr:hypothetical protein [Thermodesulfobacteriota bacterium]MEE4352331.1 hypothetical protein [Desulfatiglans sp.]
MRSHRLFFILVFVFIPYLLCSCSEKPIRPEAIQAPDVSMITCLPAFVGGESITLAPVFAITNPGDTLVGVTLNYQLDANKLLVGKSMTSKVYIPPHETVEVKDALVIPFKAWFASEALSGKGKKGAVMAVAPLWKGLGGERSPLLPEALWEKIPSKEVVLSAKGSAFVEAGPARKMFRFVSEWKD